MFIGSEKLGFSAKVAMVFAMGADCINVAREAMMSIGCIQAQVCHTNRCPTGISTQSKWIQNGINVPLKTERLAPHFRTFKKELTEITHAAGYEHPCQCNMNAIEMNVDDHNLAKDFSETFRYKKSIVIFKSFQHLKDCEYLGAQNKAN